MLLHERYRRASAYVQSYGYDTDSAAGKRRVEAIITAAELADMGRLTYPQFTRAARAAVDEEFGTADSLAA